MKKAKLASLISLILANVAGLCLLTVAWFVSNNAKDVGGSEIVAVDVEFIDDVKFHPYYTLSDQAPVEGVYTFGKSSVTDPDMGKYSIIGSDFQLMIEITLSDYASTHDFSVYAKTRAEYYLGEVEDDGITPKRLLSSENNSLSSIVCFYSFSEDELTTIDDAYYQVDISGKEKNNFIKTQGVGNVLNQDGISFGHFSDCNKVFIVLDYDISLIEEIYSLNLGNEAISSMDGGEEMSYLSYNADFYFYVEATSNE